MFDEILKQMGLRYEDLTVAERETLNGWYTSLSKNEFTIETIRNYISAMKEAVEAELEKFDNDKMQDLLLKARLKNYRLLEAFLMSPEKAKEALQRSISSLVTSKKAGEIA